MILVTGGSGFVGINLIEKLLDDELNVVNFALTPVPEEARQSFQQRTGRYTYVQGDVLDRGAILDTIDQYGITKILHGAVITPGIDREKESSHLVMNVNCMGTIQVLEAAKDRNIEQFIYISSVSVYGDTAFEDALLDEGSSKPQPRTLYEISKHAAEKATLRYKELHNLNVTVVRLGQVFGPWEHYSGIRDTFSGPFQAARLAMLNEPAIMHRPGFRDWVYSKDIAGALAAILKKTRLSYDIYNIGSGNVWSIVEWCDLLKKRNLGFTHKITTEDQEANIDYFVSKDASPLSVERLIQDVDYQPAFGLAGAFEDYMTWMEEHSLFWTEEKSKTHF